MYSCDCPDCKDKYQTLASNSDNVLLEIAEKAFKKIYKTGYDVKNLFKTSEFKSLLIAIKNKFNLSLNNGLQDNEVPEEMLKALQQDVYIFSALKTHAQLYEASRQLIDENGKVRSFAQYQQAYKQINQAYNKNYLEAEYEFAIASAQSVPKWAKIEQNKDRYNLQYRTAGDERVRVSHRALDRITLPPSDTFWSSYYPPNGWRCRCIAIEVLKDKYETSDTTKANEEGNKATTQIGTNGKNRLEIFRFNAGKDKVIFPPHHPYRKIQDADTVRKLIQTTQEKTFLREQRQQEVFKKPISQQYSTIYKSKKGSVEVHDLVNVGQNDYDAIIETAKLFAQKGQKVSVLPEIHPSETVARKQIFKGYSLVGSAKNPDLRVGKDFFDLKRPSKPQNIVSNANNSSMEQDCPAIISDEKMKGKLSVDNLNDFAKAIFQNKYYTHDTVYFVVDNTLYDFNR